MASNTSSARFPRPLRTGTDLATACWQHAVAGFRAVAFWTAIVLPLAYVPAAYGLLGFNTTGSTIALIAVHAVCFLLGHEHATEVSA